MQTIVNVDKIEKYYGNKGNITKAIDNVSFKVNEGEFIGIMGPSGSGKTTMLNFISTIDNVTTANSQQKMLQIMLYLQEVVSSLTCKCSSHSRVH